VRPGVRRVAVAFDDAREYAAGRSSVRVPILAGVVGCRALFWAAWNVFRLGAASRC
jgi:hypothetical protein